MSAYTKFQPFVGKLGTATFNFSSHIFKALLSNVAPVNTNAVKTDLTEISAGNGYTAGGATLTITSWDQSAGTAKWVVADQSFTASGGSIADFRYVTLYDGTTTSGAQALVGFYDYGSTVTITTGNSFLIDFDGTNGVLQIT